MPDAVSAVAVAAVRTFNRFYTRRIGVLGEHLLASPFSLAEMRVLYELAHADDLTAVGLQRTLGLDAGYLSRILKGFREQGLLEARASGADARHRHLRLTAKGRKAFAPLDRRSSAEAAALLEPLATDSRDRLVRSLASVQSILDPPAGGAVVLREPRPGDMGWVIHRHGTLYAHEYGWDATFEALVAEIAAKFVRTHKPARERCWIAEREGEIVGCVFLVERSRTVAQLRLLLVEPSARGLRIGSRLVEECLAFARVARYRRMMLWTNSVLNSARHIYERAGFKLVKEEKHHSFGHDLVGQNWELNL